MAIGNYLAPDLNQFDLAVGESNPSIAMYGEEKFQDELMGRLGAHNRQSAEVIGRLAAWTDQPELPFGGYGKTNGSVIAEEGRGRPRKTGNGYGVGLPLLPWSYNWGWSWAYGQQLSIYQGAKDMLAMLDADARSMQAGILDAIFRGTNYDFTDTITREGIELNRALKVKALANADGLELPSGPTGERFDASTHTHYAAETGFTAGAVAATIQTVREHTADSRVEVWIPQGLQNGIRGMPNFIPLPAPAVLQATTRDVLVNPTLDVGNIANRAIGEFDSAPVYVKPQMPSGYLLAIETNTIRGSVVAVRYSAKLGGRNLIPVEYDRSWPMYARTFLRNRGFGVWNRVGAAVLKPNNADTTYVAPTIVA